MPDIDQEIAVLSELFNVYVATELTGLRFVYYPLPTEILETIFILCARNHHTESFGDPTPAPPSWINVSYVCRQWRDVALNCGTLWTYLFNTSPRWTEELLARSKQASLKLNVNLLYGEKDGIRFFEQVIHHSERIQDLCLYISRPDYNILLSRPFSRAPHLEHLEIVLEGFPTEFPLPSLFLGDTPALRTLELLNCPMPWYSLKLTTLVMLKLENIPFQFQQDTADFLATLRSMPNLQHLYVEDSLAPATDFLSSTTFYNFQKIDLPHLSQVLISDPVSTVVALLSCINFPLDARVDLCPDLPMDEISPVDAYTPLYSLLAQRYGITKDQTASRPIIRSLGIQCDCAGEMTFNFSTLEHDHSLSVSLEWRHRLPSQILLSLTIIDEDDLVGHACRCIPLANIQSLDITYPPSHRAFWTDVLGHYQDVRYMKLSNGVMPNMISLLSAVPQDSENQDEHIDRGPGRLFAPALEELQLHHIRFPAGVESDVYPVEVINPRSISDALATRKASRGRLIMVQCVERISDYQVREFDMEGTWVNGHFRTVSYTEDFRMR